MRFYLLCDCCGRKFRVNPKLRLRVDQGRCLWLCPTCGSPTALFSEGYLTACENTDRLQARPFGRKAVSNCPGNQ